MMRTIRLKLSSYESSQLTRQEIIEVKCVTQKHMRMARTKFRTHERSKLQQHHRRHVHIKYVHSRPMVKRGGIRINHGGHRDVVDQKYVAKVARRRTAVCRVQCFTANVEKVGEDRSSDVRVDERFPSTVVVMRRDNQHIRPRRSSRGRPLLSSATHMRGRGGDKRAACRLRQQQCMNH